jgi:aspartyl protease family protein
VDGAGPAPGRVKFLVDTGATIVALTEADARRLGLDPAALDYETEVQTAAGETLAARVRLRSISVAGARVDDVDAVVVKAGLNDSLLGMSYLGRLSRFEATRSALILRP